MTYNIFFLVMPQWIYLWHIFRLGNMDKSFKWMVSIIDSCTNDFHFSCIDGLISLFKLKYTDDEQVNKLTEVRNNKWNSIHAILV
jgi:hypothetical protein